ncbi:heme ABC exporter ATP-binding protein CcmA [bacterium]|nr:heme ABC exporter ATP-binding protein CcmA [bacterium]
MLTLNQLTIRRGGVQLVQDLGITLFPGALLLLRGPNGSGKTSLLKIIAGKLKPAEGTVEWNKTPVNKQSDYWRECQYLGHNNGMWPELTVEENLYYWAEAFDALPALPIAVHLWQLKAILHQPYKDLSQGWKRRVANARMLLSPGKCWLLDEPMANLDREGAYILETIIHSRCQQGGIVVVSSHIDMDIPGAMEINIDDYQENE